MAGPNLELFKFGLYVFFPVGVMFYFGNPDWYQKHVVPLRDKFWPPEQKTIKPPHDSETLRSELARLRAERHAKREATSAVAADPPPRLV